MWQAACPRHRRYNGTAVGWPPTRPSPWPEGSTRAMFTDAASLASSSTGSPARTPSPARKSLMWVTPCSAAARSGEVPRETACLHSGGNARTRGSSSSSWGQQQQRGAPCMHVSAWRRPGCLRARPCWPCKHASAGLLPEPAPHPHELESQVDHACLAQHALHLAHIERAAGHDRRIQLHVVLRMRREGGPAGARGSPAAGGLHAGGAAANIHSQRWGSAACSAA